MIITKTVKELDEMFADEMERLGDFRRLNSNDKGQYRKCDFVRYLLASLDDDVQITVETVRGTADRGFELVNAGSLVECIVKAHLGNKGTTAISKEWNDENPDTVNGKVNCEIKFSGDAHFKCSKVTGENMVILVNCSGVSIISKKVVLDYTDKKGQLPAKGLFGNRNNFMVAYLERVLGIEGGFEPAF